LKTKDLDFVQDWLSRNPTSPITRSPLTKKELIPNRSLREAIESHCKANNIKLTEVSVADLQIQAVEQVVAKPAAVVDAKEQEEASGE